MAEKDTYEALNEEAKEELSNGKEKEEKEEGK